MVDFDIELGKLDGRTRAGNVLTCLNCKGCNVIAYLGGGFYRADCSQPALGTGNICWDFFRNMTFKWSDLWWEMSV